MLIVFGIVCEVERILSEKARMEGDRKAPRERPVGYTYFEGERKLEVSAKFLGSFW